MPLGKQTPYRDWLYIEITFFFMFVFSGIFFLLMAYFQKYQSIFRGTANKRTDLWDKKDASDFLSFLRVEFTEFSRHAAFFVQDFQQILVFI